jgi:hypothetical protein
MSTSTTAASTLFIDLATYSELEGFLYGGPYAVTLFVASVQKANWFSFLPITLRHCAGTPDFGQRNVAASVNRSGDYVLNCWFRAQIPRICLEENDNFTNAKVGWTRNLMHNLIEKAQISFNELVVEEFDNYWLDVNTAFRLPANKRVGYNNMIGNVSTMTLQQGPGTPVGDGSYRSVVLPFWFGEDSGLALPVAALPFNDIKINYIFRRWQELVVVDPGQGAAEATVSDVCICNDQGQCTHQEPRLLDPQTFAHYAVVHNDERVKMGDAPRDMLIRQVQQAQIAPFKDVTSRSSFDLRLSHAIVHFFYLANNVSLFDKGAGKWGREWSNYTSQSQYANAPAYGVLGADPLAYTQLLYENTPRLSAGSDYFSLIHPYLLSEAVPDESGYHMYSYALKPWSPTCPSASTNYSKLANVSIAHDASPAAIAAADGAAPMGVGPDGAATPLTIGDDLVFPQKWHHVFIAQNWNIAKTLGYNRRLPHYSADKQCYRLVAISA